MSEERSVRDELNHALVEGTKRIILERIDEETLRRYLLEETAQELLRLLQGWDLRETVKAVVKERVGYRIPEVVDQLLSRDDFRNLLIELASNALEEGIKQGAGALRGKLSKVLAGERIY